MSSLDPNSSLLDVSVASTSSRRRSRLPSAPGPPPDEALSPLLPKGRRRSTNTSTSADPSVSSKDVRDAATAWLLESLVSVRGAVISRAEIYDRYSAHVATIGGGGVNDAVLGKLTKAAFPGLGIKRPGGVNSHVGLAWKRDVVGQQQQRGDLGRRLAALRCSVPT